MESMDFALAEAKEQLRQFQPRYGRTVMGHHTGQRAAEVVNRIPRLKPTAGKQLRIHPLISTDTSLGEPVRRTNRPMSS